MKKRILSLLLAVSLLMTIPLPISASAASSLETQTLLSEVSTNSWMSAIRGETKLTEITIPGTHDTGAKVFEEFYAAVSSISKCQNLTIPEQLEAGARFLDIRLEAKEGGSEDGDAFLTHGVTTVRTPESSAVNSKKYYLDRVMRELYAFLDEHPTETVLVCMKKDKGDVDITRAVYDYIHGIRTRDNSYFYGSDYDWTKYWYVGSDVPTLDEVRGKCVLVNRYNFNAAEPGIKIDWNDQGGNDNQDTFSPVYSANKMNNGYVQDRYEWSENNKVRATREMLELGHTKGMWYISFSSTASTGNPENASKNINPQLPGLNYTKNKPSGIYLMDFMGTSSANEFTRKLIENNEAVSNVVHGTDGNITYTLNRKTKTLTISGNGAMNNYSFSSGVGSAAFGSNAPWGDQPHDSLYDGQYNTDLIENIVIEEGVTTIGDYAFGNFDHVKSVSIPSTVTSIGHNAFEYCSALTSVDISGARVTSIGAEAFKHCTSLTSFYTSPTVSTISDNAFTETTRADMYGAWGIYSNTFADSHSIRYIGPLSVNAKAGNTVYEPLNPFAGRDLSGGVTISFSQYCNSNKNWNGALLSFSSGRNADNQYFIVMANGAILFNDGTNGVHQADQCYFDIYSSNEVNPLGTEWADIDITISSAHILKYYVNGTLKKEYDLNSLSAYGYPSNGLCGNNGVFSFLGSNDIHLFYGASFSQYADMAGTAESYLDNVSFYTRVLTETEIKADNAGSIENTAVYYNNFDSDTLDVKSGDCSWIVGYKEHPGVLHFPDSSTNGDYKLYANGEEMENGDERNKYSDITAVYTGSKNVIGWQTAVRNGSGFTVNNYEGDQATFTLTGNMIANAVLENNAGDYRQLDFTEYDSAYATAMGCLDAEEQAYTTDSLNSLSAVMSGLVYAPAEGAAHTQTLYDTYQAAIDAEAQIINNALDALQPVSNFGRLDKAYYAGERFLESLDGKAPLYTETMIRNLRTALNNAKVYEKLTSEQRLNHGSASAQADINAKALAIETAYDALRETEIEADLSAYQALVKTAQSLDTDVYDYKAGEMDTILKTLTYALTGDNVTYTDLEGGKVTVKTIDDYDLDQSTVDSVVSLLLSSLTEHIRMYTVRVAAGTADIGFNGNGKSIGPDENGICKTTYNSTAVFTADIAETAWYMEYDSNTASRTKQYQGYGEKYATPVLGDISIYAVSRTDSNYKISIIRDYGSGNCNHPTQLIDFTDGDYTLPAAPAIPYYTFDGYYMNGNKVSGTITITADTEITAQYIADDTKDCAVKITDTSGNILYSDTVMYNTLIPLKDENAYAWVELVKDGTGINYRPFFIGSETPYFATESTELAAVTEAQFNAYGFRLPAINMKQSDALVTDNNGKNMVTFNGQVVEDASHITLETGVLIGRASTGKITADNLTVDNTGSNDGFFVFRAKSTKKIGANQFSLFINNITGSIYYRGYIIYETPSGEIVTEYTDVMYQTID